MGEKGPGMNSEGVAVSAVKRGDRFTQIFPPTGDTLEVERVLNDTEVAVRRSGGARQVFPLSTLTCGRYWVPVGSDCAEVEAVSAGRESYRYTVHLRVDVHGPDSAWEDVAERLADRISGTRLRGGYEVRNVWVDESDEPGR